MTNGLIVTATDTNVGKTVLSAALVGALEAEYWKPIQAGLSGETDIDVVKRLSNVDAGRVHAESYRLTSACSPHRAAEIDGVVIEPDKLAFPEPATESKRPLIVEGAGGLLVPLSRSYLQIEQFGVWGLPIVLCARTQLGTINHTLLSVEAISRRNLVLKGIAFVGDENVDTERTIAEISGAKILGRLPNIDPLDYVTLGRAFKDAFRVQDFQ